MSFWKQSELVERLKGSDELQKNFVRIAAHELKNPIQPIVALAHLLQSKLTDKADLEIVDIIDRNANKLLQLSDDVLDVTRIDPKTLNLRKESFDIVETIRNFIGEYGQSLVNTDITISLKSFELDDNFLNKFDSIDKMTMCPLSEKLEVHQK